jgi:hypothetical protein
MASLFIFGEGHIWVSLINVHSIFRSTSPSNPFLKNLTLSRRALMITIYGETAKKKIEHVGESEQIKFSFSPAWSA